MEKYAAGIMWIEQEILGLEENFLIVEPNKNIGELLLGYVVNYEYDESWKKIIEQSEEEVRIIGNNGRKCYLEEYEFTSLVDRLILPRLS